jgi:nitroreductase
MKVGTPEFKNIFRNAAAVIFVAAPDGLFAGEDVGCLGQNMMLAATELGLGTCFLGSAQMLFAEPGMEIYLQSLGFTNGYKLRYALAVGYPDEAPAAKERDLSKIKFVE